MIPLRMLIVPNPLSLIALSCAIGGVMAFEASGADTRDDAAVRQVVEGIIAADNAEDLEQVLDYYATNAVLIVPDGPDVVGLAAIRRHYVQLFANADFVIVPSIDEIVVDRDRAIVRGVNRVTTKTADGTDNRCVASKYLMSTPVMSSRMPFRILFPCSSRPIEPWSAIHRMLPSACRIR